jgi:hypothetical protein
MDSSHMPPLTGLGTVKEAVKERANVLHAAPEIACLSIDVFRIMDGLDCVILVRATSVKRFARVRGHGYALCRVVGEII